jgi:hypothetical protein
MGQEIYRNRWKSVFCIQYISRSADLRVFPWSGRISAGVVSLLFAIFFIILLTYRKIWVVVIAAHPKGANRPAAKAMADAAPEVVTG